MSKLSILKQKTKRDVDMTQGSIFRHLITFAFPLLIGNIFQQLYNTVDTWVVGNYVSNEAFSAVGTVGPVINMLIGIFLGLSSGAGVVISQYYGAKRYDKVRDTVHTSIAMTLILAVLFTVIGIAMIPFVLNFMKTPAEVMPESSAYLTIYFAGVIGLMLYNVGAGILRAVGNYASGMVISIATIPITNMLGGTQVAWIKYGAVIALIVLLSLLICYANGSKAMRKAVEDDTAAAEPEEEPVNFLTAVKCLFGNKYWVIVLLFNLITAVSSAIAASSGAYYCKWIFGNDNLVAIAGSAGLLSTLLGFVLSNPIIKKLGVKGTINLGLLGYAASCAVRCFVPTNLAAYIGSDLVGSFLQIPLMCLYGVLLAMAVDYNEYKYDKKLVAVSSGAIGFGNKVGGGLGALVLALFLMIGSYDSTLSAATTSMRYAIYAFSNYLPIVLNVGMFLIFRGFDLEEKLPAMRAEVAKRHTQKPEE